MSSMLAKRLGARKVMTLINNAAYVDLVQGGLVDVAISPEQATIGSLVQLVRRGSIHAAHSLRRGAAEAIEAIAHGDSRSSRVVGRQIRDVDLPAGASIGAIVRGEEVLIAPGARSARMTWDQVADARPDVVVLMPCGLSLAQVMELAGQVPPLDARVVAVDASGLFSRPGPRLVDGVEVLAAILHPQPGDAPPGDAWAWVHQPSGYTRRGR